MKDEKKARGGYARAEALTPEERSASAVKAAKSRWEQRAGKAAPTVLENYSNVLNLSGMKLPCAVIEMPDGEIKRVISENGITNAILGHAAELLNASKKLLPMLGPLCRYF